MKCSTHFGAKRRGLIKVNIVLAPKGAIQNFIKNIRYDRWLRSLALFTILVRLHASDASWSPGDIIFTQLACPPEWRHCALQE